MFKWFGKMVAEKVVAAMVGLAAIGLVVLAWRYHEQFPTMGQIGLFLGAAALWLAVATVLPWATFFLVAWVQRADSNVPAAALLVAWACIDGVLAWWLLGAGMLGPIEWFAVGMAFALGGLYNLIAANQIAARLQRR